MTPRTTPSNRRFAAAAAACVRSMTCAATALLGACAVNNPESFTRGMKVDEALQRMGAPTGEHLSPTGTRRLEFARGPLGRQTYMLDFDTRGQLVDSKQVLTEAHFNTIKAGMSAPEVLAQIGRPSTIWALSRQKQNVWSYRYDTTFCQWFMVGMGYDNKVIDTAYGPDPLCDPDESGLFGRLRMSR